VYSHILVATDGSELATKAVHSGAKLAKTLGARITLLYCAPAYHLPFYPDGVIVDWPEEAQYNARVKTASEKLLAHALATAAREGVAADTLYVQEDAPHVAIIATAHERGCDLVVMSTHGRSALGSLILGSTAQKVLAHSQLPVLVTRG
jgi:nucleotide-binding universal stress UspA family protein